MILPVNRVKPHTQFHGPSGERPGEDGRRRLRQTVRARPQFHATGPRRMNRRLAASIAALRATGRLLGGVGTVEAANGAVVDVQALTADEVGGPAESALLETARAMLPGLPFDEIDVLIIEQGGKDISGTTIDPNVTGRFWIDGLADLPRPRVATIVLLALTPTTAGSALGIGFADFVPASLAASIDWEADVPQLPHGRTARHPPRPPADGPPGRGVVRAGRPRDLRAKRRRAQAGRAHPVDTAPHAVLGQRSVARRVARGCPGREPVVLR